MDIRSPIVSPLWNRIDLPVRFILCNTGRIGRLAKNLSYWRWSASDYHELGRCFERMKAVLASKGTSLKGKTVMEVGPGNSYALALNFLMCGAKRVILVDKYCRMLDTEEQRMYAEQERRHIQQKYGKPVDLQGLIASGRISYVLKDVRSAGLPKTDFLVTHDVLEHIYPVEDNIAAMARVLRRGGFMYHDINLADHYNLSSPFLFYKYSDRMWERWLSRKGLSYTNRYRYDDFMRIFSENGLFVVQERLERKWLGRMRLDRRFSCKDRRALEVTYMSTLLRKG